MLSDFFKYGPIVFVTFPTLSFICLNIFYLAFATTDGQVLGSKKDRHQIKINETNYPKYASEQIMA